MKIISSSKHFQSTRIYAPKHRPSTQLLDLDHLAIEPPMSGSTTYIKSSAHHFLLQSFKIENLPFTKMDSPLFESPIISQFKSCGDEGRG